MAYTKTTWVDHLTAFPNRYTAVDNGDGTFTLTPNFGTVSQAGTPISAANLNNVESGIASVETIANAALPKTGGTITGALEVNSGITTLVGTNPLHIKGLQNDASNIAFLVFAKNNGTRSGYLGEASGTSEDMLLKADLGDINLITDVGTVKINSREVLPSRFNVTTGAYEVFEGGAWKPVAGVKSVQRGYTSVATDVAANTDVTISAVDISKTFVSANHSMKQWAGSDSGSNTISARLQSSTSLRIRMDISLGGTAGTTSIPWEVIEYY